MYHLMPKVKMATNTALMEMKGVHSRSQGFRLYVSYKNGTYESRKVLVLDDDHDLDDLTLLVVHKLLGKRTGTTNAEDCSEHWRLLLDGTYQVEHINELRDSDHLVLLPKKPSRKRCSETSACAFGESKKRSSGSRNKKKQRQRKNKEKKKRADFLSPSFPKKQQRLKRPPEVIIEIIASSSDEEDKEQEKDTDDYFDDDSTSPPTNAPTNDLESDGDSTVAMEKNNDDDDSTCTNSPLTNAPINVESDGDSTVAMEKNNDDDDSTCTNSPPTNVESDLESTVAIETDNTTVKNNSDDDDDFDGGSTEGYHSDDDDDTKRMGRYEVTTTPHNLRNGRQREIMVYFHRLFGLLYPVEIVSVGSQQNSRWVKYLGRWRGVVQLLDLKDLHNATLELYHEYWITLEQYEVLSPDSCYTKANTKRKKASGVEEAGSHFSTPPAIEAPLPFGDKDGQLIVQPELNRMVYFSRSDETPILIAERIFGHLQADRLVRDNRDRYRGLNNRSLLRPMTGLILPLPPAMAV